MRLLHVGVGARGKTWARILREINDIRVVGYVDPDPAALAWAREFDPRPDAGFFPSLEAAAVEADAALLATPPAGHRAQAETLLTRGLHLLIEKPLALDIADAVAIVRAAEAAGRRLGVVLNFRYLPVSQALRRHILARTLGDPHYGVFLYLRDRDGMQPRLNKYPLEMDDPMLLEQSIHHFDLMRYCYAREVEAVTCLTWNAPGSMYRGDAVVGTLLRFAGGLHAVYLGTWVGGWNTLEFLWRTDCADGILVQQELFDRLAMARKNDPELRPVPLERMEPFIEDSRALVRHFARWVAGEGDFPCTGKDHVRTLGLTLAAAEAAREQKTVTTAEFWQRHGIDPAWLDV